MDIRPAEEYRDVLHKGDREQNEIGKKISLMDFDIYIFLNLFFFLDA